MPQAILTRSLWLQVGSVLLTLMACSHDAPRENPLDPELTPAVRLLAVLSDSTGAVTLRWSRYDGDQPFAQYILQRRAVQSAVVETLAVVGDVDSTSFLDTGLAPATSCEYRVWIVSAGGLRVASEPATVSGYGVHPVTLMAAEPDAEGGALRLRWTRYRDPGFSEYRLVRREVGTDREAALFTSSAMAETTFTDTTALHGVRYVYTLEAAAAGERLPADPVEGLLELAAVQDVSVDVSAETASALLTWAPYRGTHFQAYEVRRWTQRLAREVLTRIEDRDSTRFADTRLRGNTAYFYEVAVITDRGEDVTSVEVSGAMYMHEATWRLDVPNRPFVRLAMAPGDTLAALVWNDLYGGTSNAQLEVHRFVPGPGWVDRRVLGTWIWVPCSECMALAPRGDDRYLVAYSIRAANASIGEFARVLQECEADCGQLAEPDPTSGGAWQSTALLAVVPLVTVGAQPYTLQDSALIKAGAAFETAVGELRTWQTGGRSWVGVSLPDAQKLLIGRVPESLVSEWGSALSQTVGPVVAWGDPLTYPISFDAGPDGSLFVLDAGLARVVVFDRNRRYITQWGTAGEGEGQFNFGHGAATPGGTRDYAGSIAVDSQGKVYVADELESRIQVFSPR